MRHTGKQPGVPVNQLLGEARRDKTSEGLAEKAFQVIERRFTALKFDLVPGPWRSFISCEVEVAALENVASVR